MAASCLCHLPEPLIDVILFVPFQVNMMEPTAEEFSEWLRPEIGVGVGKQVKAGVPPLLSVPS